MLITIKRLDTVYCPAESRSKKGGCPPRTLASRVASKPKLRAQASTSTTRRSPLAIRSGFNCTRLQTRRLCAVPSLTRFSLDYGHRLTRKGTRALRPQAPTSSPSSARPAFTHSTTSRSARPTSLLASSSFANGDLRGLPSALQRLCPRRLVQTPRVRRRKPALHLRSTLANCLPLAPPPSSSSNTSLHPPTTRRRRRA